MDGVSDPTSQVRLSPAEQSSLEVQNTNLASLVPGGASDIAHVAVKDEPTEGSAVERTSELTTGGELQQMNRAVTVQPSKPNRELKVEDALHYLDQVKLEFSEKPHIYNEFLEIMKNFKTQSINTPGVIARVKNLFRGYNKLILGFNTFLPEGDGYKIELSAEEEALSRSPHPDGTPTGHFAESGNSSHAVKVEPIVRPDVASGFGFEQQGGPPAAEDSQGQPGRVSQNMQQEHAIHYVTTIRNRFSNEPETYRHFLKILHTYQKEQRGIKEVLEQVSHLFADHPDLLMEFTYFLPDAVQDQAKERLNRAVREAEMRRVNQLNNPEMQPTKSGGKRSRDGQGAPRNVKQRVQAQQRDQMNPLDISHGGMVNHMVRGAIPPFGMHGGHPQLMGMPTAGGVGSMGAMQGVPHAGYPMNRPSAASMMPITQLDSFNQGGKGGRVAQAKRRTGAAAPAPGFPQQSQTGVYEQHAGAQLTGAALPGSLMNSSSSQAMARIHSLTAERRFFEQVKDIISLSSRDSWTEFVKCLELFSNDVISRKDMFTLVQDLFGPAHQALFEEFKALLFRRTAYDSSAGDMWYAVPLCEIDFSQCLKCTPSYRALPKDYPKPLCSDRGTMEASVLNDNWVSIPIGSEESYSFKHMRKNQYEEALFKCEDDRFEIDMLIDTNMSTMRVLEPLNEEIQHIKQLEQSDTGCPKFNFQLEKRHLSTVHLNCITRLYGDFATEILELLRKNPVGAIPVILKRLKQKDLEWRKARQELTKTWKEVLAMNSERSFDHRSFYHKAQDKRTYNAKHLVNDIKITGANPDAPTPPELGPLNVVCPVAAGNELLKMCGPDIHPCHLLMNFENEGKGIHRDIYRIFCHATEMSSISSVDKERVAALWRDFIRVFFDFPVHFMFGGAAAETPASAHPHYSIHLENGADASADDITPPWEIGTTVLTLYGTGKITGYRAEDGMHSVRLPFGITYMRSSCILGAEQLSSAALQAIGVTRDSHGRDVILNGLKPALSADEAPVHRPQEVFFGTQMCYVFMRLYHTIYVRLLNARRLSTANSEAEIRRTADVGMSKYDDLEEDHGYVAGSSPRAGGAVAGTSTTTKSHRPDAYSVLLTHLMSIVDGTLEPSKFEDHCRQLLGNKSFFLYTIDKVLQQALKCLQAMANDETVTKLIGVYLYHRNRSAKTGVIPSLYRSHVSFMLSNTMEEVYRMQFVTSSAGETSGMSGVACQCLGTLSFDMSTVDATLATVATPRAQVTPKAPTTGQDRGSDSANSSAVKAPQLVLPDVEEDDDEEEEEDEPDDEEDLDGEVANVSSSGPAARRRAARSRTSGASVGSVNGDMEVEDEEDGGAGDMVVIENGTEEGDDGDERSVESGTDAGSTRRGETTNSRRLSKEVAAGSGRNGRSSRATGSKNSRNIAKSDSPMGFGDILEAAGYNQEPPEAGGKAASTGSGRRSGGAKRR